MPSFNSGEEHPELTVIAAWFIEQPLCAKKIYMTMVIATEPQYMPKVEPIRIPLQARESWNSIFSRQYSAHV